MFAVSLSTSKLRCIFIIFSYFIKVNKYKEIFCSLGMKKNGCLSACFGIIFRISSFVNPDFYISCTSKRLKKRNNEII